MEHDGVSCGGCTRSESRILNTAHVITRRSSSDYVCLDCDLSLPGYEYGDERSLYDHVYVNNQRGGTCRYIQDKFKNDLKGYKLMLGTARFRRGYVAFPDYIFYGVYGYVQLFEIMRCVVCTTEQGKPHPPACSEITERLRVCLHKLKLHEPPARPLFASRNSFGAPGAINGQLECDGVNVTHAAGFHLNNDKFAALGEKANMTHVYGTDDAHVCGACATRIAQFEEGDTLLREHVYHVYNEGNTCAYLERLFSGDAERLKRMVAEERHRKGFIAYADKILQCDNGVSPLDGCVTCAAVYEKGFLRHITHSALCSETRRGLTSVLRHRKLM